MNDRVSCVHLVGALLGSMHELSVHRHHESRSCTLDDQHGDTSNVRTDGDANSTYDTGISNQLRDKESRETNGRVTGYTDLSCPTLWRQETVEDEAPPLPTPMQTPESGDNHGQSRGYGKRRTKRRFVYPYTEK